MAGNGNSDNLTPRQRRFVDAMMASPTIKSAALAAEVSVRTAHTYLDDPHVKVALGVAQSQALAGVTRQLVGAMTEALRTLRQVNMTCEQPAPRVSAARAILEYGLKSCELVELERRVSELEARMESYRND